MGLFGDILGGIGGAVTGLATGGPLGAITGAARGAGLIDGQEVSGGKSRGGRGRAIQERQRNGFDFNPPFGGRPGVGIQAPGPFGPGRVGVGERPPSRNGRQQQAGGQVAPMIGAIGTEPRVVGNITRKDGSTGPILRCEEPNFVLAIDNRCYPKKMVSKSFRKWPPDTKPPVTRGEWKALLKARRAAKGIERMGRKLLDVRGSDRKTLKVRD